MRYLILLFTVVPLVELWLLFQLADVMGTWQTVLLVLVTGVLGAALAKSEGLRVLKAWQASLARGELPAEGVLGGVLVLVGGVLLVTPGVMTDLAGLLLLLPPTRRAIAAIVKRRVARAVERGTTQVVTWQVVDLHQATRPTGDVIDVDGEESEAPGSRDALPPRS